MLNKPNEEAIAKFDKSSIGQTKNAYFKRTTITGIISIMISLVWLILNIYYKLNWYEYLTPCALLVFGNYFIIQSKRLKYQEVNKFIYNEQNKK